MAKRSAQVVGRMPFLGDAQILPEQRPIVRVGAVLYNLMSTVQGPLAAEVGNALFGNDNINIVLRGVDMRAERHDGRNLSVLGRRRRGEYRHVAVALIVARAADAVHQSRGADVAGVLIAVDIAFDGRIDGDAPEAAYDLRRVGYLALPDDEVLGKEVDIVVDMMKEPHW